MNITTIMNFISRNIAYIMLVAAVFYFIALVWGIRRAKRNGEGFRIKLKNVVGFALVIGIAIYCLVTGQDLSQFIG